MDPNTDRRITRIVCLVLFFGFCTMFMAVPWLR